MASVAKLFDVNDLIATCDMTSLQLLLDVNDLRMDGYRASPGPGIGIIVHVATSQVSDLTATRQLSSISILHTCYWLMQAP